VKTIIAGACALSLALVTGAGPAQARKKQKDLPPAVGTLIDNVNGETPDGKGGIAHFSAILIGADGRILDVYASGDKRPERVAYRLDGKGRVMVPGMIDAHARVMDTGFTKMTLDLSSARTLDEALARITAWAAAHPDAPWILGSGWDDAGWGASPTAAALDRATGGKPAWLVSRDGQSGWANSAALSAAGIGAGTADPVGGRIGRAGSKQPDGLFTGTAMPLVEARVPRPRPEDLDTALGEAQLIFLRNGITAVADMGTTIEDWQSYRRTADAGNLRIRIVGYADGVENMALIGGPGPTRWLYDDRLRLTGLNLVLDGSLGSHGAWLKAPYADAPGARGLPRLNQTQLGNLASRAALDNFQVAIDANGDEAAATALDTIEELSATYKGDRRWRIEGAEVVDPSDLPRLARNGTVVTLEPQQVTTSRAEVEARLGTQRLARVDALRSIAATGATVAFGSNAPAYPPEPFVAMAAAISRTDASGQPFGGWQPQEAIGREAALAGWTSGAAKAMFADDRLGRIAKGYRADFLFVDRDPLLASPDQLRQTRVLETWINGQRAWSAGEGAAPEKAAATSGR